MGQVSDTKEIFTGDVLQADGFCQHIIHAAKGTIQAGMSRNQCPVSPDQSAQDRSFPIVLPQVFPWGKHQRMMSHNQVSTDLFRLLRNTHGAVQRHKDVVHLLIWVPQQEAAVVVILLGVKRCFLVDEAINLPYRQHALYLLRMFN